MSVNAGRAASFNNLVHPAEPITNVHIIGDSNDAAAGRSAARRYAVVDTETLSWGRNELIHGIADVPPCWVRIGTLHPDAVGLGTRMVDLLRPLVQLIPGGQGDAVRRKFEAVLRPAPAYVYEIPSTGC